MTLTDVLLAVLVLGVVSVGVSLSIAAWRLLEALGALLGHVDHLRDSVHGIWKVLSPNVPPDPGRSLHCGHTSSEIRYGVDGLMRCPACHERANP